MVEGYEFHNDFDSLHVHACTVVPKYMYLIGRVLQCHGADPGIDFAVLFDD